MDGGEKASDRLKAAKSVQAERHQRDQRCVIIGLNVIRKKLETLTVAKIVKQVTAGLAAIAARLKIKISR
ncbi:hypothetical protein C7477_1386 [Phyllobacterium leguminum]|uniref:Uncharacterized protein n=1 Tax=Phyllobacterium leguminum TaxID=314237 RepID=A0A318SUV5_9HYPH|nr:hypothetical protein C7477_1386 [Phyllobacterium leguminum]